MSNIKWFRDPLSAWEYFNESFIVFPNKEEGLPLVISGNVIYLYNMVFGIENPVLPNDLDFGKLFNYHKAKWISLVNNYLTSDILVKTKSEVAILEKKNKVYNYAMGFSNNHSNGKSCLLSIVFCKRAKEKKPTISIFMRSSEITKRLLLDFLLIWRIGEYVYGNSNFKVVFSINQMYNDINVLLMYNAHKNISKLLKLSNNRNLLEKYNEFLEKPLDDIKYKIHKRVAKVLKPDFKNPVTLVEDCILPYR